MSINRLSLGLFPFLFSACNPIMQERPSDTEERGMQEGRISIPLEVTTESGNTYRLQLPSVLLEGTTESMDLDLRGQEEMQQSLREGEWLLTVNEGWSLERLEGESYVPVDAEIISANPTSFFISGGESTTVVIRLLVVGEVLEFGYGDLEIDVVVDDVVEDECSITVPEHYQAGPHEVLSLYWEMDGDISDEVYLAVFSEWGETYYLSTTTVNDGHFDWVLPGDLDPELSYHVYVENASNGERLVNCWKYTPLDVTEVEPDDCSVEMEEGYEAFPGESIRISWEMTGAVSEQVYISVSSEGGQNYYLSTFTDNDGSLDWTLPEELDPQLSYNVYVEDAEDDERLVTCWTYADLEVLD